MWKKMATIMSINPIISKNSGLNLLCLKIQYSNKNITPYKKL
jgi:hypothetical protein